jgi:cob(I)alamin adenosyltransferase
MAIYTKTGDKGKTGTFGGKRVSKSSKLVATIGAIDELNSFLGIVGDMEYIQESLFTINSILSGSKLRFSITKTKKLERELDKFEGTLPVQKNFIYYGGTLKASHLFYARALTRKVERTLVTYSKKDKVSESILIYVNRLSDYLFMLARNENYKGKEKEKFWRG